MDAEQDESPRQPPADRHGGGRCRAGWAMMHPRRRPLEGPCRGVTRAGVATALEREAVRRARKWPKCNPP